jgi:hypothetical protein
LRNLTATTATQAPQVLYVKSQDENSEPKLDPMRVGMAASVLVLATVGVTMFFTRK